jgi:hypothetical protein
MEPAMARNRRDILDFLSNHKKELQKRFGVARLGLFGSYARAEARESFAGTTPVSGKAHKKSENKGSVAVSLIFCRGLWA